MFQSNRFPAFSNEDQPQINKGDLIAWSMVPIVLIMTNVILNRGLNHNWFWAVIGLVLWAEVSVAQVAAYVLSTRALKNFPHKWQNLRLFCYILLGLGLSDVLAVWLIAMFDFPIGKAVAFSLICGQTGWLVFEGVQRVATGKGRSLLLFVAMGLSALALISWGLAALPVQIESRMGDSFVCAYLDPAQDGSLSAPCVSLMANNELFSANRGVPLPTLAPERISYTCKVQPKGETQLKIINNGPYRASVTIGDYSTVVIPANSISVVSLPHGKYQFVLMFEESAQIWPIMRTISFDVDCFDVTITR